MRSTLDRIRHILLFEGFLLLISTCLISFLFNESATKITAMGILLSLMAMGWNYIYNILFDKTLLKLNRPLYPRGLMLRTIHTVVFESGFALVTIPTVMFFLKFDFWQALVWDLGFLVGVPIYTIIFNWLYDFIFPVTKSQVSHA